MGKSDMDIDQSPLAETWAIFGLTHVPYRILLLSKMIDRLTTRHVRQLANLSLAEWRVVAHLAAIGSTSSSQISRAALVDRAETSRAVRSLREKGLITRLSDPADQRKAVLGLTDKGHEIYRSTHAARGSFFADLTQELEEAELRQLDAYLFKMAKVADRMLTEADQAQARRT